MAFPTLGILDDFNRANETPIASPWAGPIFTGETQLRLVSNQLANDGSDGNSYLSANYGPDLEMYCTLTSAFGVSARVIFYFRTVTGALVDGYRVQFRNIAGDHLILVDRIDDNSVTQLGANIDPADTIASGDSFGVTMNGTTIEVWYKAGAGAWTSMGTRTDATYAGTGKIGFSLVGAVTVDNFGGGEISAPIVPGLGDVPPIGILGRGAGW